MDNDFHLLDLPSQVSAVQQILNNCTIEDKLEWLAGHGQLSQFPIADPNFQIHYRFVSFIGRESFFFFLNDEFVFIGNHTNYVVE